MSIDSVIVSSVAVTGKLSGKIPISSQTSGKFGPGVTVMVDWTFKINYLSVHDVTQRM